MLFRYKVHEQIGCCYKCYITLSKTSCYEDQRYGYMYIQVNALYWNATFGKVLARTLCDCQFSCLHYDELIWWALCADSWSDNIIFTVNEWMTAVNWLWHQTWHDHVLHYRAREGIWIVGCIPSKVRKEFVLCLIQRFNWISLFSESNWLWFERCHTHVLHYSYKVYK